MAAQYERDIRRGRSRNRDESYAIFFKLVEEEQWTGVVGCELKSRAGVVGEEMAAYNSRACRD